ncbi:MAG TPA: efflux RND transporter periplasmic adaptor subunit [Bacteroidales bacterium]|nr:efflux RND transporter periplasmic adaptor subunit [Bacteroidales bacterium]HPM93124.1 efflux RND transporter periplasmic adaptor subunit [Bacteroidales bacterium]
MKFFQKKRNLFLVIGGVILIIILVILAMNKGKDRTGTKVTAEKVEKRTIIEMVSANGKIQPEKDIKISPYISGEVIELYVKEGDQVKKGDLLAKIDPEIYRANYDRMMAMLNSQKAGESNAQARVAQVEAQFRNAELSFNRSKTLWEQKVISDADFDAAKSSYEVAKAEKDAAFQSLKSSQYGVESAEASLKEAKENLFKTTIISPSDGTVSKLSVEIGERVTGASQFSAGTEIMRIANLQSMEVNVEVNENDIVRVSLFDTCQIEVDAYLDKKFKGIVTEISTSANTSGVSADQITNFNVKIRILPESYTDMIDTASAIRSPFRPGMSATVDIQTETVYNILAVPIQSVTTRSDTTGTVKEEDANIDLAATKDEVKEYIFLVKDGKALLQEVKTGIQDITYIEVKSGVEEGQEVITAPYRAISKRLKNGDPIKVVDKKDLYSEEEK